MATTTIDRPVTKSVERGLVITREFDASREEVWKAWTDPEIVKRWWGPKAFTTPVSKVDLRVGGTYLNCMRSPEKGLLEHRRVPGSFRWRRSSAPIVSPTKRATWSLHRTTG